MTILRNVAAVGAISLLAVPAFAVPVLQSGNAEQQKFDNKGDFGKGTEQLKAQTKGNPYGDPARQKALNDAMREDATPTPAPKKSGTATPQ